MDKAALLSKLKSSRGTWPDVARRAGVSYSWVVKFANDKIPDPRLGSLERLEQALSSTPVTPSGVSAPQQ